MEDAHVLPALCADGPLRVVGGVVGDLVAQAVGVALHEGHERPALQTVGRVDAGDVAQGGVEVEVGDHRVDPPAAGEPVRSAHEQHHADAPVEEGGLGPRVGEAVVGGADDEGVVRDSAAVISRRAISSPTSGAMRWRTTSQRSGST